MINIRIQVFSNEAKDTAGMHLEVDPCADAPKPEKDVATCIISAIRTALAIRSQGTKHGARFIECSGDSEINKQLRKEFGLDDNDKGEQ